MLPINKPWDFTGATSTIFSGTLNSFPASDSGFHHGLTSLGNEGNGSPWSQVCVQEAHAQQETSKLAACTRNLRAKMVKTWDIEKKHEMDPSFLIQNVFYGIYHQMI
ncbi:transcription factor MYB [Forsythia ovata]|uniref:Transcription factor MYB n=1 Tax=Forsythia ovata TaxID=205694 RepID=A0ABD1QDM1_9LAMI